MSPLHMITVKIFKVYGILVLLIACFQVSIFMNQTLAIFYVKILSGLEKSFNTELSILPTSILYNMRICYIATSLSVVILNSRA